MNNNDEYLFYAGFSNEANGAMTTFLYNGECLLYNNIIQC